MKKHIIKLTAIYILLLGLSGIILNYLLFIELFIKSTKSSLHDNLLIMIMWLLIVGWTIATGIGLLKKSAWARYSLLVLSVFLIIIGITFCFVITSTFSWNDHLRTLIFEIMCFGMNLIFLLIFPIFNIIIFNREPIKEQFINNNRINGDVTRPVGISILAIFFLVSGCLVGIDLVSYPTYRFIFIFGYQITGWYLSLYQLITAIITIYIAFGFWKMKRMAWFLVIVLSCFDISNGIFNFLTFDSKVYLQMFPKVQSFNPVLAKLSYLVTPILAVVILIYITSKKNMFLKGDWWKGPGILR